MDERTRRPVSTTTDAHALAEAVGSRAIEAGLLVGVAASVLGADLGIEGDGPTRGSSIVCERAA